MKAGSIQPDQFDSPLSTEPILVIGKEDCTVDKKADQKQSRISPLDEYMFDQLKNAREYSRYFEDKAERTINYYLVLVIGIITIVAGILVGDKTTEVQKFASLALGSLFIGGVGVLVYLWEMSFATTRIIEGLYTTVFHLYFRSKDPEVFDAFGLPNLLTVLRRRKQPNHQPILYVISLFSIQLIGLFSSAMLGFSFWSFCQLVPQFNLIAPMIFGMSPVLESILLGVIIFLLFLLYAYFISYRPISDFQKDINAVVKKL